MYKFGRSSAEDAGAALGDSGKGMSAGERSCEAVRSGAISITSSGLKISLTVKCWIRY